MALQVDVAKKYKLNPAFAGRKCSWPFGHKHNVKAKAPDDLTLAEADQLYKLKALNGVMELIEVPATDAPIVKQEEKKGPQANR